MAPMNTGSHNKFLFPGLKKIFGDTYQAYAVQYEKIFDKESSNKYYELYQEASDFGLFQVKTQGGNISFDNAIQGYQTTLTNVPYANGFEVTHELEMDDQYNYINKLPARLAVSAQQTKEIVAANILNNGFNGAFAGADGESLFSTAHPTLDAGVYKNRPTIGTSLSETSLTTDYLNISNLVDGRGKKIMVSGKLLVVPAALAQQALKLTASNFESATANNAVNTMVRGNSLGFLPEGFIVNNFLTSPTAYFIRTSADGLVYQNREDTRFMEDETKRAMVRQFMAYFRCAFGWYDPRSIYGNQGL